MRRLALVFLAVFAATGLIVVANKDNNVEAAATYSQIVDNSDKDRFRADEGWGTSSYGRGVYEEDYSFARSGKEPGNAQFKVEIPEDGDYAVYARWPKVKGLNAETPFGVKTASGVEWTKVNQRQDGGRWVKIGVFKMQTADDYAVFVSWETDGEDYVGADAVKVEQVRSSAPVNQAAPESDKEPIGSPEGRQVVEEARRWIGTPYRLGGSSSSEIDCSALTMRVYEKFGEKLPHWDEKQYGYGEAVRGEPQAGDIVFFDEHGDGISHVGIATGTGNLVHASSYFDKVVESDMKDIKGYKGARRLH